jgi:hypothetical protein
MSTTTTGPPPRDDQLPPEPPDVDLVVETIVAACELAEVWLTDGDPATPTDRLRLHAALKDAGGNFGRLNVVRKVLEERLAPDLPDGTDEPVLVDGRWWRRNFDRRRRGPDTDGLQRVVTTKALATVHDLDTGEVRPPTAQEAVARMWRLCSVATGRTKVLREVGVDLDEFYEVVEDVPVIEEVK